MDRYRIAARKSLENTDDSDSFFVDVECVEEISLKTVWDDIHGHQGPKTDLKICEDLLVAQTVSLHLQQEDVLSDDDREAANALIVWVTAVIPPSQVFEGVWEEFQLSSDEARQQLSQKFKIARTKATLGLIALERLCILIPLEDTEDPVNVIATLAAFTNPHDPWTTIAAASISWSLLGEYGSAHPEDRSLVALSGDILERFVKPSFSKTKTPAITSAGRKDLHPVKQPYFDPSTFDKAAKPWKYKDVSAITVLNWVVQQYKPSDCSTIEAHFPLLIPAILSLIDDESLPYKAQGCKILYRLLSPLAEAKSDILKRTNLDSVFGDAITPCLLYLPTLTPEDQSIYLLQAAYPAIFSIIRTRFPSSPPSKQLYHPAPSQRKREEQESQSRTNALTRVLRQSIISSYHHISSPHPSEDTYISSFPHPQISTLLLNQLTIAMSELGVDTVKHLQEIIPILTSTLTNPFGTAYLPLLVAATECMQQLILSAWPRVWRWRAELLAGVCGCWLHVEEDWEDIKKSDDEQEHKKSQGPLELKETLKKCVQVLKAVLEEAGDDDETSMDTDAEFKELADGDIRLRELFE
ncbi:hypothetical protein CPC735_018290 [Coccidioides posadasii C735 delta SOWgp]|uniref:Uncharacterized protein n=1 Tax=Coccidioides posadasii (strain C735) TaxID=222929 RepID=C5PDR4_COCP7|nr:hypothetical protein CPC735_018290 [Coccidioides posadasii C735 delta SOWgp]EER25225.1 hypothetical protein CPC735_018290 [Coccidioides posadasii C735 delta SOWgp]|eukprot:XP_003067370.1 hypothetical protein CPC735_018290 [Coccidioides posadasii C735 delta SOWgp]